MITFTADQIARLLALNECGRVTKDDLEEFLDNYRGAGSYQLVLFDRRVETLGLHTRAWNCLAKKGVICIGQLVQMTDRDLLKQKNCGRKTLKEIKDALAELGVGLNRKDDVERLGWKPLERTDEG